VTVTLAPATAIEPVAGNNQTVPAGSAVPVRPSVKVTNALGQGIAGYGVTFVVTGGGGSVTGGSQTTNTDGVATVGSWTLGASPGQNTLEARTPGLTGSPVVFTATGTPMPDHLVFRVQPSTVVEKRAINPAVEVAVVDKDGNVTPSSGIVIHLALVPSRGDLRGATDQPTQNGVAVFGDLKVNHSGTGFVLVASVGSQPDLGQVQSAAFDVKKN
jgi:adhesin/invasin